LSEHLASASRSPHRRFGALLRRRGSEPQRLWEYDRLDLTVDRTSPDEQAVAAIRDLLLERVTTGWDLDGFEARPDRHHFVFKRPVGAGQ
jgi:hypothetical protein